MSDCFAIFEGGGAKGFAHIGALKGIEERNLKILGVAGASAGSIVASLVAARHTADEIFSLFQGSDWVQFLDRQLWEQFKDFRSDLKGILPKKGSPGLGTVWRARQFNKKWTNHGIRVSRDRGIFSTKGFEIWLNGTLAKKLNHKGSEVTFETLRQKNCVPLKLVSVDIEAQRLITYCYPDTADMPVAKAVAASISIPFFFVPTQVDSKPMVDGGIMSNFPAWLFETERSLEPAFVRTYGFTLGDAAPLPKKPNPLDAALDYALHVAKTAIFGGQTLVNEGVELFRVIPIKTKYGVLDFELSSEQKMELYSDGLNAARGYFDTHGVVDDAKVRMALEALCAGLRSMLTLATDKMKLRANVMLPVRRDEHLRVTYTYNMDDGADDRLLLSVRQTGAGDAFQRRTATVNDFREIRKSRYQGLSKYDAALIPKDLIALFCIPIFRVEADWKLQPGQRPAPMAILAFDANEDVLSSFNDQTVQEFVERASIIMGRLLRGEVLTGDVT